MLQMGHVRVSDFLAGSGLPKTAKEKPVKGGQPSTNGATNGDVDTSTSGLSTVGELKSAMGELLKNRFLIPVQEHHMHPYTDVVNDVRQKLSKELRAGTTSELKLKKLVDAEMKTKLRTMAIGDNSEHAGMKRRGAPDDVRRPGKRQKVSTHDTFYDKEPEYEIDVRMNTGLSHSLCGAN